MLQLVQDTTENTETTFVNNIPNFVYAAEERINNTVQLPVFRKQSTALVTTINTALMTLPTDFLAPFSIAIVIPVTLAQTYLLNKDVEYIRQAFPLSSATGAPTHYAIFSSTQIILGPTPDAAYATDIQYFAYPTSIVTAGTSWVGNNFGSALLYGTLREAAVYMKAEPDMIENYDRLYQDSLGLLKQLGDGKDRMDTYRTRQVRQTVQ